MPNLCPNQRHCGCLRGGDRCRDGCSPLRQAKRQPLLGLESQSPLDEPGSCRGDVLERAWSPRPHSGATRLPPGRTSGTPCPRKASRAGARHRGRGCRGRRCPVPPERDHSERWRVGRALRCSLRCHERMFVTFVLPAPIWWGQDAPGGDVQARTCPHHQWQPRDAAAPDRPAYGICGEFLNAVLGPAHPPGPAGARQESVVGACARGEPGLRCGWGRASGVSADPAVRRMGAPACSPIALKWIGVRRSCSEY